MYFFFFYFRKENDPIILTVDHNLSKDSDGSERERLKNAGIKLTEGQTRLSGLGVTRALGDFFAKEEKTGLIAVPHVSKPIKLKKENSFLIVASDGVKNFFFFFFIFIFLNFYFFKFLFF